MMTNILTTDIVLLQIDFCDILDKNDIKVEEFPLLEENTSLDELDDKFNEDIKVKAFSLLQESTSLWSQIAS